ncbi:hypothetical protein P8452_21891 [Trifolium repens]|nr:hypothetical protein P8452_21891 [Trifolium repens]
MSTFSKVSPLLDLHTRSLDWTIKVRVLRMWYIKSIIDPEKITEIHLILLDQESKKIEATVPAECVDRFSKILFESGVYMIVYFRVEENVSSCMSTFNQFKLLLNQSTIMFQSQSLAIPRHSLTLFTSQRIANYRNGASYLIDFVGVVTDVYAKPVDEVGQEITNAVRVLLTDSRYLIPEMNPNFI